MLLPVRALLLILVNPACAHRGSLGGRNFACSPQVALSLATPPPMSIRRTCVDFFRAFWKAAEILQADRRRS